MLSATGFPAVSRAGVNLARLLMSLQVALSRAEEPLGEVTVQFETRPSGPISSRNPVVPCSSERTAEGG
jgi:hypothetical protein